MSQLNLARAMRYCLLLGLVIGSALVASETAPATPEQQRAEELLHTIADAFDGRDSDGHESNGLMLSFMSALRDRYLGTSRFLRRDLAARKLGYDGDCVTDDGGDRSDGGGDTSDDESEDGYYTKSSKCVKKGKKGKSGGDAVGGKGGVGGKGDVGDGDGKGGGGKRTRRATVGGKQSRGGNQRRKLLDEDPSPSEVQVEKGLFYNVDVPYMDGSATILRRDATPLRQFFNVLDIIMATRSGPMSHTLAHNGGSKHGLIGFYWDPKKNLDVVQCAFPVNADTASRGLKKIGILDRCEKKHIHDTYLGSTVEPILCGTAAGATDPSAKSCIQNMLEKRKDANNEETKGIIEKNPTYAITEVVINRERNIYHGSEAAHSQPTATGWFWAHQGSKVLTIEDFNNAREEDDLIETKNRLCRLYSWDAELWQPTGKGLDEPRFLLQMVWNVDFPEDKPANEVFSILDLHELCGE